MHAAEYVVAGSGGLLILDYRAAPADPSAVAKITEALELIASCDRRRADRIARDLRAVALLEIGSAAGAYVAGSRTCYLNPRALDEESVAVVAILIAHEATHARLDSLRFVKWWPPLHYHVKHRCLCEELALAARLPRDRFPTITQWAANRAATSRYRSAPRRNKPAARSRQYHPAA